MSNSDSKKNGSNVSSLGTTPFQQIVASCSGAILTSLFMTPLDVVKVRLQAQQRVLTKSRCFLYSNGLMDHICTCANGNHVNASYCPPWYSRPSQFNGTLDAFVKIARNEGITSLWSGLPPTLVMAVPATVCYFTSYDNLNMYLRGKFGDSIWISLLSGGTARFIVASLVSPIEMVRTKMQSEKLSYKELSKALKLSIGGSRSIRTLYIGWGATLLRDVPFSGIYWAGYEALKALLMTRLRLEEPTFGVSFVSGAAAGSAAALLTLPFDVVKTHQQITVGNIVASKDLNSVKPLSTWKLMKQLRENSGWKALFSGAVPRVLKVAPACAIMIGTYEYGKLWFRKWNRENENY